MCVGCFPSRNSGYELREFSSNGQQRILVKFWFESNIKYQIYCTQIVNSINYPAASTAQVVLLYSGAGRRLVPFVLSSPLHHSGEEIHQLVLHIEVCIASQVFVSSAPGQVLLVLFNFQVTGLAHPPGGLVLVVARVVARHVQHVAPKVLTSQVFLAE